MYTTSRQIIFLCFRWKSHRVSVVRNQRCKACGVFWGGIRILMQQRNKNWDGALGSYFWISKLLSSWFLYLCIWAQFDLMSLQYQTCYVSCEVEFNCLVFSWFNCGLNKQSLFLKLRPVSKCRNDSDAGRTVTRLSPTQIRTTSLLKAEK